MEDSAADPRTRYAVVVGGTDDGGETVVAALFIDTEYIRVADADMKLFGNRMRFNTLSIHFREPVTLTNFTDPPQLTAITTVGLVVSTDDYGERDVHQRPTGVGFHNNLIPWSNITYLHQYVDT